MTRKNDMTESMKDMKNKKRLNPFYTGYIIFCGALFLILAGGIVWFYDFIAAYEMFLPDNTVQAYVDTLDRDTLSELISPALDGILSGFERESASYEFAAAALSSGRPVYAPSAGVYTDELPVYDIYCNNEKLIKLTLTPTDGGKYGMTKFIAAGTDIYGQWFYDDIRAVSVIIPHDAHLTVNGKSVTADYISDAEYPSAAVTEFERDGRFGFALSEYIIDNVYGEVEVAAEYDGRELALLPRGEDVYFCDYSFAVDSSYRITAPADAVVSVNGIVLSDDYYSAEAKNGGSRKKTTITNEFETDTLPELITYEITGLMLTPEVSAELHGAELIPLYSDADGSVYDYPDAARKSYTVRIPSGDTLYCNGVAVGDMYITGGGTYTAPESADGFEGATERFDEYTVTGLYNAPEFTSSDILSAKAEAAETSGVATMFYPVPDEADADELYETAKRFTELFIKYSYEGTKYTEENFNAVMPFVTEGSDAYKIISVTYDSMRYNSNFKVDKLDMKIYDMIKYSGDCISVKVDFDSHGKYYKYEKSAAGTYDMLWQRTDNGWKLIGFTL